MPDSKGFTTEPKGEDGEGNLLNSFLKELPAPTDNTRLAFTPLGKSRLNRDFANPKRYRVILCGKLKNVKKDNK